VAVQILPPHHDYQLEPIDGDFKKKLSRYKTTAAWKKIVASITERDQCCQKCGYDGPKKEVHHIHYRAIHNCTEDDLILLCSSCHNFWHKIQSPTPWREWISDKLKVPWNGIRKKDKGNRTAQRRRWRHRHPDRAKVAQRIKTVVKAQKAKIASMFIEELKALAQTNGIAWPTQAWAREQIQLSEQKQLSPGRVPHQRQPPLPIAGVGVA
jgi:hypothetical protein